VYFILDDHGILNHNYVQTKTPRNFHLINLIGMIQSSSHRYKFRKLISNFYFKKRRSFKEVFWAAWAPRQTLKITYHAIIF